MGQRFERLDIHKIMHGFADDNDLFQDIKLTIDMKPNQNVYSVLRAFKDQKIYRCYAHEEQFTLKN